MGKAKNNDFYKGTASGERHHRGRRLRRYATTSALFCSAAHLSAVLPSLQSR
jgi:hypothetical protein